MALLKLAALGAAAYVAYNYLKKEQASSPAAFAPGQGAPGNFSQVRDAGPDAMASDARRDWSKEDQALDESFPASDPPSTY
ncbi:MAG: hypothetical protein RLZZ08_95 [Pseudomonadota bacterium]|jgi:hypothetical protein